MSALRFSLLSMLGLVSFVGLSCAALAATAKAPAGSSAPYWWSSAVVTLTALFLGLCLLGAIFSRGQARCGWAGAAVAGTLYWMLVFSTWFGGNVGTRLISSRAIVWAEQKMYASAQQPGAQQYANTGGFGGSVWTGGVVYSGAPVPVTIGAGGTGPPGMGGIAGMPGGMSGGMLGMQPVYAYYTPSVATPTAGTELSGPPTTAFQEIAHYLVIWPLAVLGGLVASLIYARSRRAMEVKTAQAGAAAVSMLPDDGHRQRSGRDEVSQGAMEQQTVESTVPSA